MRQVIILGSTGTVGRQALDLVRHNKTDFKVIGLTAHRNIQLLVEQIKEFQPRYVAITDDEARREFVKVLPPYVQVIALDELTSLKTDVCVVAMSGICALTPTLRVIRAGTSIIAMANKEAIIAGGKFLFDACKKFKNEIIPVDSEHSGVWQCMKAGNPGDIRRAILTASGGPFKDYSPEQLAMVTPQLACRHPVWKMGAKITVDSATLMNKGFEVIEAMNLFNLPLEKVDVVVHPEGVVHSMVEFVDNSVIACMSYPDMRVPLLVAMAYPNRFPSPVSPLDLTRVGSLHFERPNLNKFRCMSLALEAARLGEASVIALSAADEVVVPAFLEGRIGFMEIPKYLEMALGFVRAERISSVEEVLSIDMTVKKYIRSALRY